jgi:hypothetical protein
MIDQTESSKVLASAERPMPPNAGKGRVAGVPNRTTARVREAIAQLAENNLDRLQEWLERGAVDDPLGAARVFVQLLEFNLPRVDRIAYRDESRTLPIASIRPVVHVAGLAQALKDALSQFEIQSFSPSDEGAPEDYPGEVVMLLRDPEMTNRVGMVMFARALRSLASDARIRIFMSAEELRSGRGAPMVSGPL